MSVFSPAAWLSRSRCTSNGSRSDFSKDDTLTCNGNDGSLQGLSFLSQHHSPSLESTYKSLRPRSARRLSSDRNNGTPNGPSHAHAHTLAQPFDDDYSHSLGTAGASLPPPPPPGGNVKVMNSPPSPLNTADLQMSEKKLYPVHEQEQEQQQELELQRHHSLDLEQLLPQDQNQKSHNHVRYRNRHHFRNQSSPDSLIGRIQNINFGTSPIHSSKQGGIRSYASADLDRVLNSDIDESESEHEIDIIRTRTSSRGSHTGHCQRSCNQSLDDTFEKDLTSLNSASGLGLGSGSGSGSGSAASATNNGNIQRTPSFGNGSCISSLSADETVDYHQQQHRHHPPTSHVRVPNHNHNRNQHQHRSNHSQHRQVRRGRDFGNAFDHIVTADDLLTDDNDHHHHDASNDDQFEELQVVNERNEVLSVGSYGYRTSSRGGRSRSGASHGSRSGASHGHIRSQTRPNLLMSPNSRPKAVSSHMRTQSDTMAFRPRPHTAHGYNPGHGHHKNVPSCSSNMIPMRQNTMSSTTLPVHATLRETIASKRERDGSRLLSKAAKPQILQSRSTSLTLQNSSTRSFGTTTSYDLSSVAGANGMSSTGSKGNNGTGVWNGQHIDNFGLIDGPMSPTRIVTHSRSRTVGHVDGNGGNYIPRTSSDQDLSNSAGGSGTKLYLPNIPKSHRSTGSGTTFFTQSETATLSSSAHLKVSNSLSHVRQISESSSALDASSVYNKSDTSYRIDTDLDSQSVLSSSSRLSKRSNFSKAKTPKRKGKISFKDDIKFALGKMVPAPLKNVGSKKNKVKLERCAGCLT